MWIAEIFTKSFCTKLSFDKTIEGSAAVRRGRFFLGSVENYFLECRRLGELKWNIRYTKLSVLIWRYKSDTKFFFTKPLKEFESVS